MDKVSPLNLSSVQQGKCTICCWLMHCKTRYVHHLVHFIFCNTLTKQVGHKVYLVPEFKLNPNKSKSRMYYTSIRWWPFMQREYLIWIHTKTLAFFSRLSGEPQCFHSDSTPPLSDKMLKQSVFRWPVESCVMSVKCSSIWTILKS